MKRLIFFESRDNGLARLCPSLVSTSIFYPALDIQIEALEMLSWKMYENGKNILSNYRENCFCQILDLKEDEDDRHSGGTLKRTFLQRIKYIYIGIIINFVSIIVTLFRKATTKDEKNIYDEEDFVFVHPFGTVVCEQATRRKTGW